MGLKGCTQFSLPLPYATATVYRRVMAECQGRSSGSRINLPPAPSHSVTAKQWYIAEFVPDYSGGTAPGFNGIPY